MNETDIRINATLQEIAAQRSILGDRGANLAAELAALKAENAELKKKLAELGKSA